MLLGGRDLLCVARLLLLLPTHPPHWQETTALHFAARNGHLEVVMLLLSRGALVDAADVSERGGAGHMALAGP